MSQSFANPFDFEKPIRDPQLFAGRSKELKEIDYYLELCRGDKPVFHNLAMIGTRASGKTSLLNMTEQMAKEKGILSVKVSLNAESSTSEVILFKEVFDGIMTKGAELGMFGGIGGKIYRSFRKIIDMLDVEANVEIPLLFGTAYIGVKKGGVSGGLSQQVLVHDLKKLSEEAKKNSVPAIALLFDECDLLAKSEILLQKLRNIFSDIDGYIMIFAGTESMFPAISEVFSPIPRFFKKIDVGNFVSLEETKECILKPLSEQEKPLVSLGSVTEIHVITGGNPYEVQLISHYMYRKHKEAATPQIALDIEVLNNVLVELERLREGGGHEVADVVRRCYPDQLRALLATLECPSATAEPLSRFMVLSEVDRRSLEELSNQVSFYNLILQELVGKGITKNEEGKLRFSGSQFDVLHLKYFALSKGISEFQFGIPDQLDLNVENKLGNLLLRDLSEYETNVRFDAEVLLDNSKGYRGRRAVFGAKVAPKGAKPGEWVTVISFTPAEMENRFYFGDPSSIRFRVNVDWLKTGFVMQTTVKDQAQLSAIGQRIESLRTKLLVLGVEILLRDEVQITTEANALKEKGDFKGAQALYDEALRLNPDSEITWANKGLAHFQSQDFGSALKCFEKWTEIRPRLATAWEQSARALLNLKEFAQAAECLQKAVDLAPEVWSAWDNRGRALLNVGKYEEAVASFDKAIALKPDDLDAIVLKGVCYVRLDRPAESLSCFDQVISRDSGNRQAHANKAVALFELGRLEASISIIEKLLGENANDLGLLNLKSVVLDKQGKEKEAIGICGKILEIEPRAAVAYYNRACFKAKSGKREEALIDLEKALQLEPFFMSEALGEPDLKGLVEDPKIRRLLEPQGGGA